METRDVLKERSYARLLKEESAKVNIISRLIGQRPKISSTADIVGEDYEAVRADVNGSKTFVRSGAAKTSLIVQTAVPGIMVLVSLSSIFLNEDIPLGGVLVSCFAASVFLVMAFPGIKKLLSRPHIEVKVTGIRLNKHLYAWTSILDTYIVIRKGKGAAWQLVLLTDSGKIIKMSLQDFSSLQHNAALDISYYIEHYKRLQQRTAAV
jgi:hypothetical protein